MPWALTHQGLLTHSADSLAHIRLRTTLVVVRNLTFHSCGFARELLTILLVVSSFNSKRRVKWPGAPEPYPRTPPLPSAAKQACRRHPVRQGGWRGAARHWRGAQPGGQVRDRRHADPVHGLAGQVARTAHPRPWDSACRRVMAHIAGQAPQEVALAPGYRT